MILVTGASGALGGLILDRLTTVAGVDVVAGSRSPVACARRIDFDRPSTLVDGFGGVDVLVFVSAGAAEDDVVLDRHGGVIRAAAAAGVRHVIYTSLVGSGDRLTIALAHRWTEARLADALFDFTILRNGLYAEIPARIALAAAESAAATGVFRAPLGCGRMSVVAREDLAEAAAQVAVEVQRSLDAGRAQPPCATHIRAGWRHGRRRKGDRDRARPRRSSVRSATSPDGWATRERSSPEAASSPTGLATPSPCCRTSAPDCSNRPQASCQSCSEDPRRRSQT